MDRDPSSEGQRASWLKSEGSARGVLERARKYSKMLVMFQVFEVDPEEVAPPAKGQHVGDNGIVGIRPPTPDQDDEPQDTTKPWQIIGIRYYNKRRVAPGTGEYGGNYRFWTGDAAVRNRPPYPVQRLAYCAIRNWARRKGDYGVTKCPK